jgi:hypothetical protein
MADRNPFSGDSDPAWLGRLVEEVIEPGLPIIDPHHHLWVREGNTYLLPELLADTGSGHNIILPPFSRNAIRCIVKMARRSYEHSAKPNS